MTALASLSMINIYSTLYLWGGNRWPDSGQRATVKEDDLSFALWEKYLFYALPVRWQSLTGQCSKGWVPEPRNQSPGSSVHQRVHSRIRCWPTGNDVRGGGRTGNDVMPLRSMEGGEKEALWKGSLEAIYKNGLTTVKLLRQFDDPSHLVLLMQGKKNFMLFGDGASSKLETLIMYSSSAQTVWASTES